MLSALTLGNLGCYSYQAAEAFWATIKSDPSFYFINL